MNTNKGTGRKQMLVAFLLSRGVEDRVYTPLCTTEAIELDPVEDRPICNQFRLDMCEATRQRRIPAYQRAIRWFAGRLRRVFKIKTVRRMTFVVLPPEFRMPDSLKKPHWHQSAVVAATNEQTISQLEVVFARWRLDGYDVRSPRFIEEFGETYIAYDLQLNGSEPDPSLVKV